MAPNTATFTCARSRGGARRVKAERDFDIDVDIDHPRSRCLDGSVPAFQHVFDFDSHYYEAADAFTRHQDRALGTVACDGPTSTGGGAS